jgi:hypothetical protein
MVKRRYYMFRKLLVMFGGLLNIIWGASHLLPTDSVVNGFGNISIDSKRILLMEWINEGFTLIYIGVLVVLVALVNKEINRTSKIVYITASIMLFSMALVSLFTGFNIDNIFFKLCPIIFSVSGIMILQGALKNNFG